MLARETEESAEVVVIGAGIMGIAITYHLARPSARRAVGSSTRDNCAAARGAEMAAAGAHSGPPKRTSPEYAASARDLLDRTALSESMIIG
jgi:glycine/D-amino acid oxidase-like deaminating enzyme